MKTVYKKIIVSALAVLLIAGLTACGGTKAPAANTPSVTIEDMIAANSTETIFSKYSNVLEKYVEGYEFDRHLIYRYMSYDLYWEDYAARELLVDDSENWGIYKYPDDEFLCIYWFAMSDEDKDAMMAHPEDVFPPVLAKYTEYEVVTDVKDNGDGTLSVTTLLDAEHETESMKEKGFPEELYNNEMESYYIVDKDTLLVKTAKYMLLTPEGPVLENYIEYEYDAEMPDDMKDMVAGVEAYKAEMNDSSTRRKVFTIIYDEGPDKEESYSITTGYDQVIGIIPKSGYIDDEETTEYSYADDGTLYVTRNAVPVE